jgi:hypothetical protein
MSLSVEAVAMACHGAVQWSTKTRMPSSPFRPALRLICYELPSRCSEEAIGELVVALPKCCARSQV